MKTTLYVGLDTDSKHIDVGLAEPLPQGEVRYWGKLANEPASVDRLVRRLQKGGRVDELFRTLLSNADINRFCFNSKIVSLNTGDT